MTEKEACTSGGSHLQVDGFNQIDMLDSKREQTFDRLGFSVINNIDCSKGADHNMTSDVCKFKTPAHTMLLGATWDRDLVSTCSQKSAQPKN